MTKSALFHKLPTLDFKDAICDAVDCNQVVILTAETGAGKSTQVPQYLAEHGYTRVIVTQPRILAARNLTKRVREEWAERHTEDASEVIGYRTAHERDDSGRTQILYCTDGLQLVRELTGVGTQGKQVLVLDEVHEWNDNMEVLVAWSKLRAEEDPQFKVVIMSATLDDQSLAEYFGTTAVIKVPGRHHEVTWRKGENILDELFRQLDNPGRNILTFLPGKSEIQDVTDALAKKAEETGVPIIPLHSQLELEEQQKAFGSYPNGKIILSTNIAQTSVTIDDIDRVIDSGLERRAEVRSGVEGLFIAQISQADCSQRAGRAGRTKPGEYILAAYDTLPCLPFEERDEYQVPEIMRTLIDRLTLRLANVGLDIEILDFYHDPSRAAIKRAKRTLIDLGAMTRAGEVTNIGRAMEKFPVESSYGRMLVEVQDEPESIREALASIIAIQEVGGIVKSGVYAISWRGLTSEQESDLLAQYDVYRAALMMSDDDREAMGIISKNVEKATEVRERLFRDLGLILKEPENIKHEDRQVLLRAIIVGQLHHLWVVNEWGRAVHLTAKDSRELSKTTVVKRAKLLAGAPFDLQVPTRSGDLETLHLVQDLTVVTATDLEKLKPELFKNIRAVVVYDPRSGYLVEKKLIRVGKQTIELFGAPITDDTSKSRRAFVQQFAVWAHRQTERQGYNLSKYHRRVPQVSLREVEQAVAQSLQGVISLDQLTAENKQKAIALSRLETYAGDDFIRHLGKPRRDQHEKRRRGWTPKHKRKYKRDN